MLGTIVAADPLESHASLERDVRSVQLVFVAAAIVYFGTSVILVRRPLPWLIGVVPDDAFYYLQIAVNLVQGHGSTFDGVNPTNGYHPLWMLLTVACAALVDDKIALLRAMLALGFGLHFAAAVLFTRPLGHLVGRGAGWTIATIWLLNPFVQLLVLQGLEASVFLLALVFVVHVYVARVEPVLRGDATGASIVRGALVFGLAVGLACLARTEAFLAGALSTVLIALAIWRRARSVVPGLRFAAVATFVAGLVVAPWLAFSWASVGSLAQDSGAMKLLWGAEQFAAEGPLFRAHYALFYLVRVWLELPLGLSLAVERAGLVALIVLPMLALLILVHRRRLGAESAARLTTGVLAAVLVTGLFYGTMLGDPQIWHMVQPGFALFLLASLWTVRAARSHVSWLTPPRMRWLAYTALAIACALHLRGTFVMKGRYPWQRDVYASQPVFEALVPPSQAIGVFNAGIPGSFGGRRITNLDGLANHAVLEYWRRHDFAGYLRDADIHYVLDDRGTLERALRFSGTPLPREPLHEVPLTGWRWGDRVLWRIQAP